MSLGTFGILAMFSVMILYLIALIVARVVWSKRYRSGCGFYEVEELEKDMRSGESDGK